MKIQSPAHIFITLKHSKAPTDPKGRLGGLPRPLPRLQFSVDFPQMPLGSFIIGNRQRAVGTLFTTVTWRTHGHTEWARLSFLEHAGRGGTTRPRVDDWWDGFGSVGWLRLTSQWLAVTSVRVSTSAGTRNRARCWECVCYCKRSKQQCRRGSAGLGKHLSSFIASKHTVVRMVLSAFNILIVVVNGGSLLHRSTRTKHIK